MLTLSRFGLLCFYSVLSCCRRSGVSKRKLKRSKPCCAPSTRRTRRCVTRRLRARPPRCTCVPCPILWPCAREARGCDSARVHHFTLLAHSPRIGSSLSSLSPPLPLAFISSLSRRLEAVYGLPFPSPACLPLTARLFMPLLMYCALFTSLSLAFFLPALLSPVFVLE